MSLIKYIAPRIIALIVILIVSNSIYKYFIFEDDLQEQSDIPKLIGEIDTSAQVIYLGESSNFTFSPMDYDKRSISELTSEYFHAITFETVNKAASHGEVYKTMLEQLSENSSIETVIVTLNMRSFNADWIYSELETAIQKNILLLKDQPALYKRFLLSFKGYDVKDEIERSRQVNRYWLLNTLEFPFDFPYRNVIQWNRGKSREGVKNPDGTINIEETTLACHYIKTYAFQIDTTSNPRIRDFDAIVKMAKQKGWNLVFNLMAENFEKAEELVGKELTFLMKQNCDLLIERYSKMGVQVIDNSNLVPDIEYIDRDWTTEHYAEKGRKLIALNLARGLEDFYPEEYSKVTYEYKIESKYFYDLEGYVTDVQKVSISNEKSFSGDYSSKTGAGNEFSFTFEKALELIPDSTLNEIDISCMIISENISKDINLVVEMQGKEIPFSWYGKPIQELTNVTNNWTTIEMNYQIPENNKKADLIKVYIYNPTKDILFMDDLSILFK